MLDLAWLEALLNDPAFASFARGLALTQRFQFSIILGGPEGMAAVLLLLEKQVAALRRAPVRRVLLTQDLAAAPAVSRDLLIEHVLERLLQPHHGEEGVMDLLIVDASAATQAETGAWLGLFEAMNQQRNRIIAAISGPLLLCMHPDMEARFVQAASDFWSVRSGVLMLPPDMAPMSAPAQRPLHLVYFAAPQDADLLGEFEQQLAPLERAGLVRGWSERHVRPGELLDVEVDRRLTETDAIIFFLSPSLLGNARYQGLIARALKRRDQGGPVVIPQPLRPVLWQNSPFAGIEPFTYEFISNVPAERRPAVWSALLEELLGGPLRHGSVEALVMDARNCAPDAYDRGNKEGRLSALREALLLVLAGRDPQEDFQALIMQCKDDCRLWRCLERAVSGGSVEELKADLLGTEPE